MRGMGSSAMRLDMGHQKFLRLDQCGASAEWAQTVAPQCFLTSVRVRVVKANSRPGSAAVTTAVLPAVTAEPCPRNRAPTVAPIAPSSHSRRQHSGLQPIRVMSLTS
jgi:hypothetical protein